MSKKQLSQLKADFLTAGSVIRRLNDLAPKSFSVLGDEDGLLIGDEDQRVSKVGVCWDLTPLVLNKVINDGVDFIVVHTYPFLRRNVAKLTGYNSLSSDSLFPNKLKKRLLRRNNIVVYRVHSSWDNAVGGNNDVLAGLLGLTKIKSVPFGRVGFIKSLTLKDFGLKVKRVLNLKHLKVVGSLKSKINSVMVVSGTGFLFPELIEYCYVNGIDLLVSGDLIKKSVKLASELGVSLIDAGARETELPGIKVLASKLGAKFYDCGGVYEYL